MSIKAGATSQPIFVNIVTTAGVGLTGLVYNSSGLVCYYARPGAAATAISLVTQDVDGAWDSGGFVEVSAANMPGLYRLDLPNAVVAAGVPHAVVSLSGYSGMAPCVAKIDLVAYDPQDAGDLGLTDVATIKAKTDNLPASPAAVGSAMTLAADAVNATSLAASAVTEIQSGLTLGSVYRIVATPLRSGRTETARYTRGATKPDLLDHIEDGRGTRFDLTGATVTATFIKTGTEAAVFTNASASLGNAPEEGQVLLEWPADALDAVGEYKLIWTATISSEEYKWITHVVVE